MASKLERTTVRNHKITSPHPHRPHRQISTFSKGKCLPWRLSQAIRQRPLKADVLKCWPLILASFTRSTSEVPIFVTFLFLFFLHLPSFTSGVYPESTSWPSVSGCCICTIVKLFSLGGPHDMTELLLSSLKWTWSLHNEGIEVWLIVRILKFLLAEKLW